MSTRAIIGRVSNGHSIRYLRVGRDGYPDHAGYNLVNFYDTPEKIDELLLQGNLSDLGSTVKKCVPYHEPENKIGFTEGQAEDIFKQLLREEVVDYSYLFNDGKWKCWGYEGEEIDLAKILKGNPLKEAQGLLQYVIDQAETMKQTASGAHYSYKNADNQLGIFLHNIKCACKDIDSLLEKSKDSEILV
jgi:hypothetical protein